MIPGIIVVLEQFPLSAHGKLDRRALPDPDLSLSANTDADQLPRSDVEKALAEIWSDLLGVASIGRRANFFELGGDSISSLQVVNMARRKGIHVSSRQIFEEKILERIALRASLQAFALPEEDGTAGEVALTPIQHWFFENYSGASHHFIQSTLVELPQRTDEPAVRRALETLANRHDALRLRFERTNDGWKQYLTGAAASSIGLRETDLTGFSREDAPNLLEAINNELQSEIDLGKGPLLQAALIDQDAEKPQSVILVIHHLATDWVSWRILIPEFVALCQANAGEACPLPPVTRSFRRWAEWLAKYSREDSLLAELDYWQSVAGHSVQPLPTDFPRTSVSNLPVRRDVVEIKIDAALTRALLRDVPGVYRTNINDILLLALAKTIVTWARGEVFNVDLEGHGRESDSLDLTQTIGWFTSLFPVVLRLGSSGLAESIKSVKEQLRKVPNRGVGYGVLRYLNPTTRAKLENLPRPEIRFNYGGRFASTKLRSHVPDCASGESMSHLLNIDGGVFEDEMVFSWSYRSDLYQQHTIKCLARDFSSALQEVVSHCSQIQWGGYTPSDFPLTSLSQKQLDSLPGNGRNIEDIYPLSSVQAGMLFHCLHAPMAGMYYVQTALQLHGAVEPQRLARAWQSVMDRHTVLRTGFSCQQSTQPVQIVFRTAQIAWQELDWRGMSPADQQFSLAKLLEDGRRCSGQPFEPPLIRCHIIQLDDAEFRFIWQCHHILVDGWSSSILLEEFFGLYDDPSRALPAPRPFRDFISWWSKQDNSAPAQFWDERLKGFAASTQFGQRGRVQLSDGHETYQRTLPAELTSESMRFVQRHGLTMNTLIQGAYALLLSYYSGEDDVLFGVTVSGRSAELAGSGEIIGLLINTLPFRVRTAGDMPLISWLHELQLEGVRIGEHAALSLAEIQRLSQVPVGVPLFDSILVFENYPVNRHGAKLSRGVEIGEVVTYERTHYPLTVVVEPRAHLRLSLNYWPTALDPALIARMAEHFEVILQSMISDPAQTLGAISPLTASELQRLLRGARSAPSFKPSSHSLHECFEKEAARRPDCEALVFADERWTYGEVNRRANQLAHHLRFLGVQGGSLVGLSIPRSCQLVIGILAILKAGAAYVPLEPEYPEAKLSFMMEDAGISLLLSHTQLRGRLSRATQPIVWIDDPAAALAAYPEENLGLAPDHEALAYVMFTSGSTGHPKGVEVSHFNVLRLFAATKELFAFDSQDVWTLFHSTSFDFSVWEMWGALLHGGRLVIVDRLISRSPDVFLELLVKERVTVLNQTPSAFLQLVSAEAKAQDPDRLRLRFVIFGGESLVASRLRPWFERDRASPPRLINMYGITETTVHVTFHEVTGADTWEASRSVIGKAIPDLRIFLLNRQLRLVPIGTPGEMYISGPGVARGYHRRPELTRERFVEPASIPALSDLPDASRLYRSGDIARFLPDGNLEFLGRYDGQIKVRGFRVEPGEIESVLCTHSAVRESVVVAENDAMEPSRLAAYVVCHREVAGCETLFLELRDLAKRALPDHMVPSVFQILERLPLTGLTHQNFH